MVAAVHPTRAGLGGYHALRRNPPERLAFDRKTTAIAPTEAMAMLSTRLGAGCVSSFSVARKIMTGP